jgi:hypothetical protein
VPRALPPPVERPFLTGRPARPARNLFGPGESPPRACPGRPVVLHPVHD